MIDPDTGTLSFDQPAVQIGSALTREQFLSEPWAKDAVDFIINEPWHSWKLAGQYVSGSTFFGVVLFFEGERLEMVNFGNNDPKFGTSWNDWSLEKQMSRNSSHEQWLSACIGARRSFLWGSVWSGYDERSGGSSIVIRYGDR